MIFGLGLMLGLMLGTYGSHIGLQFGIAVQAYGWFRVRRVQGTAGSGLGLDDTILGGVRVEGVLDVALPHHTKVPNDLDGSLAQHVVVLGLGFKLESGLRM